MLNNQKLLIDKDCPMCQAYGHCFTSLGLLDKTSLDSYQHIDSVYAEKIDMDRARNEIALYNVEDAKTIYGLDALIEIISHKSLLLKRLLRLQPIYFFLSILYRFISFNRKIIYPVKEEVEGRNCIPDENKTYRWAYIIWVALATGLVLNYLALQINLFFQLEQVWWREYIICFGQIVWQGTLINRLNSEKSLDYLGNMSTVSLMGALLLIPALVLQSVLAFSTWFIMAYFMLVVLIMLLEHIRRCNLLELPIWMSISWVLYRTVVLLTILGSLFYKGLIEF